MAPDPPRCNFLLLAPKPQNIIIKMLSIPQIYRIAMKSRVWQKKVKTLNMEFDLLDIEVGGVHPASRNNYLAKINNNGEYILCLSIFAAIEDAHWTHQDEPFIMEFAKDLTVKHALDQHLAIVAHRLTGMFRFEKFAITISRRPDFKEMVWKMLVMHPFPTCDRIIIRNQKAPLRRDHLDFLLQRFEGTELETGRIEYGPEEELRFDFEKIVMNTTNWMTKDMAVSTHAKEIYINQAKNNGVSTSLHYISAILFAWHDGELTNLEYFRCNLYFSYYEFIYLNLSMASFTRTHQQVYHDLNTRDNPMRIEANISRRTDGKFAYVFAERIPNSFLLVFHFRPSFQVQIGNPQRDLRHGNPFD